MTKIENDKCIKLMNEAIANIQNSKIEYQESEKYIKAGNRVQWELCQRKADQHYGYAMGINQVLATLGFNHEDMKILGDLL